MPKVKPARPRAPVISLAAVRTARAERGTPPRAAENPETLEYKLLVLDTMLDGYWTALYSQVNKIRNHLEAQA